ncbi:hypothetical protein AB0P21_41375, partial [Kribbella sp. NPDC056861]|uniref:hypothetical protein n=1 Tax=Kribbella sp. NPDC056861 TaxID=3154857 RepID=UPI0034253465
MEGSGGGFVGVAADGLRGKVDGRLRGHVEDVASSFEVAAGVLREWCGVVVEQQRVADGALVAARGLVVGDPEWVRLREVAFWAGVELSERGREVGRRVAAVSDVRLPVSECRAFMESYPWLAALVLVPMMLAGGPLGLLAWGASLGLFVYSVAEFAGGHGSVAGLFLALLGLVAPTTRALPVRELGRLVGGVAGSSGVSLARTFQSLFSRDLLVYGLLPRVSRLPVLSRVGSGVGFFGVLGWVRLLPWLGGVSGSRWGVGLAGLQRLGGGVVGFVRGVPGFVARSYGGVLWTRLVLPVSSDELRVLGFVGALRV